MVQNDIRNTFQAAVAGDGHRWQGQRVIDNGVHGNETFDAAVQKNVRIRPKKLRVVTVRDGQEEEILLPKVSFYAGDDRRAVKVTDLLGDHTDHIGAFYAQIAGIEARAVIQLTSGGEDSLLRMRGN